MTRRIFLLAPLLAASSSSRELSQRDKVAVKGNETSSAFKKWADAMNASIGEQYTLPIETVTLFNTWEDKSSSLRKAFWSWVKGI